MAPKAATMYIVDKSMHCPIMVYPPSAVATIENCLPILEAFTDIESAVSLSQTCRAIYSILIDATTRKLKVSHFEVDNYPVPHPTEPPVAERNWLTAPARIPHYVTGALNAIHFPSLQRLHLDFPLTLRRNQQVIEDVSCAAFPLFVANLGYARNLEYLHFDAGRLMASERTGQIEALYDMLKQNLQRCNKLRVLSVMNAGADRNGNFMWSAALLQAIIPTIKRKRDDLRSLKVCVLGSPSDPVYTQQLLHQGSDVIFDFFALLHSLNFLEDLSIEISCDHLETLVRTFDPILQIPKPLAITHLRLAQVRGDSHYHGSALHVIDHFSECSQLVHLSLDLPPLQWSDCHQALNRLLRNKLNLEHVSLYFSMHFDVGGKIMKALVEFGSHSSLQNLSSLEICGLFRTSPDDFSVLQTTMAEKGIHMTRCKVGDADELNILYCAFRRIDP